MTPGDHSTPGFPVLHYLLEFAQTHVHWVGDAIHPTISSSVVPFSSCLQSFPASGSFPMSQLFPSGGQSIEASASASVLPKNIQDWIPLGLTGLISLQSKGLKSLVQHHSSKTYILQHSAFFMVQLSHSYMTTGKTTALTTWTFVGVALEWHHLHIWGCWYFSLKSWFQLVSYPAQSRGNCKTFFPPSFRNHCSALLYVQCLRLFPHIFFLGCSPSELESFFSWRRNFFFSARSQSLILIFFM